jgi:fatty acid desaturase
VLEEPNTLPRTHRVGGFPTTSDSAHCQAAAADVSTYASIRAVNFSLAAIHIGVNACQFFFVPIYLLAKSQWWALVLIPFAALNNPLWALIHECIHDAFDRSNRLNATVGRMLGICFGSPFHILRLTHLSHHKFNRSPEEKGTEVYDPDQVPRAKAVAQYFFYILCGLYLLEVCSTLLFFLPRKIFGNMRRRVIDNGSVQEKWLARKFLDDRLVREIRLDGIAIGMLLGLSAVCYRGHWQIFLSVLVVRTFLISFMDNVYHYRTAVNVTISGYNLSLPRLCSFLLLNFNLHRVHHRNPGVPWAKLPQLFALESETFDRSLFAAALDQLCGPVPRSELTRSFTERETGRRTFEGLDKVSPFM